MTSALLPFFFLHSPLYFFLIVQKSIFPSKSSFNPVFNSCFSFPWKLNIPEETSRNGEELVNILLCFYRGKKPKVLSDTWRLRTSSALVLPAYSPFTLSSPVFLSVVSLTPYTLHCFRFLLSTMSHVCIFP